MKEYEVTCINKSDRQSAHEHITYIGNNVKQWRLSREDAIRRIDNKEASFYIVDVNTKNKNYIAVYREVGKAPYLRTHADKQWNNNLLAQSECSSSCKIIG